MRISLCLFVVLVTGLATLPPRGTEWPHYACRAAWLPDRLVVPTRAPATLTYGAVDRVHDEGNLDWTSPRLPDGPPAVDRLDGWIVEHLRRGTFETLRSYRELHVKRIAITERAGRRHVDILAVDHDLEHRFWAPWVVGLDADPAGQRLVAVDEECHFTQSAPLEQRYHDPFSTECSFLQMDGSMAPVPGAPVPEGARPANVWLGRPR